MSVFSDLPILRRAALAFAIVSRSAADEVDGFEGVNDDAVDLHTACEGTSMGLDRFKQESVLSVEMAEDTLLVPPLGLPPGLSLNVGSGLVKTSWTEGRCLEGLAAKVWVARPDLIVGLLISLLYRLKFSMLGTGGFGCEGVSSRFLLVVCSEPPGT